ncbi:MULTISPECIES: WecB/TagA/CpsF family glycosyltransferase [Amycolatopsis]|uniref:N-acetylglucosaminyldiphosphoundecaprenol N-acetyl-beta-D-mannosaminyltransferase n=2 Tax=Amycolatopsis TaxID=1813 RepID=A0A1I3P935_9PSEU|nr:WecB/TagA/CpsF family glycosyltransferase [Amycolatopsis sacchari]SFJ17837.1 N-acetylglucosaminyldiphosphoundecaprenol N-acetyl-beta-D-mannosaminyltransferase [Amycolatopsis sacchari]
MDAETSTVPVGAVRISPLSETEIVDEVIGGWQRRAGGWIVTANVDIVRATTRDPRLAGLVAQADFVVADGMPVVWTAKLSSGRAFDRVTGASLVFSLTEAAARSGRSVYLLGGEPGVPEAAAEVLSSRYPGLRIAGTDSPPFGFERSAAARAEVTAKLVEAKPDLVLVGLGFPKQEELIAGVRADLPSAWYLGCGAGIPMAAGQFRRAPELVQRMGAEWLHRLALEPRRLARRYLQDDTPFAVRLLTGALLRRAAAKVEPRPTALPVEP